MANNLTFARRSVQSKSEIPAPRQGGLAIPVGDNIYYFGGRTEDNGELEDVSAGIITVFNTTSESWSKIEPSPPQKYGEIYIYGTAIGTDIWIYDTGRWMCFDTVNQAWKKSALSSKKASFAKTLYLTAIGVIGNSMYYYDGDHNSFEKKVYKVDSELHEIRATTDEEGFGEHPQDRHETFLLPIADDVLVLWAPYASYERDKAHKFGELFYYDLKEGKWARVKDVQNDPSLNLHAYYYCGRIGSSLYFVPTRGDNPNEWLTLDLATNSWVKKIVQGDAKNFSNYATIVGNKIYCWMSDGQMTVVDVTKMPSENEQKRIDEHLAKVARAALSEIKRKMTVIDEYVPEPIVVDTSLDAVNLAKPIVHREMVTGFAGLFPQMNQEKIIESTVASPSDSVLMHKNYLHYLTLAWSNHFSVVISPDIIFYTVLCEIADEILTSPDNFRHLFTDSTQKKGIRAMTHDVTKIDLNSLIKGIASNVPVDASIFTAEFSSSTAESRLAIQSAFCEAMSAYYFYMSTLCGIPRIKILGTKQDWELVEQKFHRMRTEVFNQDGTAEQKMSQYLQRAEEQTRKIHTTRDPEFWKDMFGIDNCQSGHTDVVIGWINQFYRKGYAHKDNGKVHYTGDDFYNYKAHISTVKWQNVETNRHFELKSGLMYSNVVSGETEIDMKFPWLEPQFCHVIVETAENGKMTPEQFRNYIDGTLRGGDKKLMNQFYEVLKDDPIEFVKGGAREIDFRLELVIRQIKAWKQEFLKSGKSIAEFDLEDGSCGLALGFYSKIEPQNQAQLVTLVETVVDYLKTDTAVKAVIMNKKLSAFEPEILEVLIGREKIEALSVFLSTQEATEKFSQLLLHPACKLKELKVTRAKEYGDEVQSEPVDYTNFAAALLKSSAPLESLVYGSITDEAVANAVAELCRRENGLKYCETDPRVSSTVIGEIILRGQLESKTLREISLPSFDKYSPELNQFIANNLPLNPSLESIQRWWYTMPAEQLGQALKIPSLKWLAMNLVEDLSFLQVTSKLCSISTALRCTAEQMKFLSDFVAREDCPLEILFGEKSTFEPGALAVLAKTLPQNKSLKIFNIRKSTVKSGEDKAVLVESMVLWLENPSCKLEKVNLSEIPDLSFEGQLLQRLLRAVTTNKNITQLLVNITCTAAELPLLVDLVKQNSTLTHVQFGGKSVKFSNEERAPLVAALRANTSLQIFVATVLANNEQKYQTFDMDDFMD